MGRGKGGGLPGDEGGFAPLGPLIVPGGGGEEVVLKDVGDGLIVCGLMGDVEVVFDFFEGGWDGVAIDGFPSVGGFDGDVGDDAELEEGVIGEVEIGAVVGVAPEVLGDLAHDGVGEGGADEEEAAVGGDAVHFLDEGDDVGIAIDGVGGEGDVGGFGRELGGGPGGLEGGDVGEVALGELLLEDGEHAGGGIDGGDVFAMGSDE